MQDRFATASQALLERYPDAFRQSAFDPQVTRARMTELVTQVEQLGCDRSRRRRPRCRWRRPTALATMLKEALASNTIGGRVDDQTKRRAAQETVRVARAAWSRLGPAAGDDAADLERRFAAACRKFDDPRDERGDRAAIAVATARRGPRPQGRATGRTPATAGPARLRTRDKGERRSHKGIKGTREQARQQVEGRTVSGGTAATLTQQRASPCPLSLPSCPLCLVPF